MVVITVKKNNTYTSGELYQWDTNRRLDIYGLNLSALPEIHFANSKMSKAIVKQTEWNENGGIKVEIPNVMLETPTPLMIYVCGYEGEEFITWYSLMIKVKARTKPEDYIADDDEKIYSYNALENLINNTLVELTQANEDLHDQITEENEEARRQLTEEVHTIVANAKITDSDTVDGFHAEDFALALKPGKTVFNLDGSITTTYDDGSSETVVFNEDGSITTTSNTLGLGVKTEIVKFNSDGSITVEVS
jgi:hypothetical protein